METFLFIKEKYHPAFVSSSHNQGWLDLCQDPAALSQTCHCSSVLGTEANLRYCTHPAINAASSFTSRWCSLFRLFQAPKQLAAGDIPQPGKPWQQWQHVLDGSSLSCSTAQRNGNQAEWAEAVWFLEVGNAGHFGLPRWLSGFQGSKLFFFW